MDSLDGNLAAYVEALREAEDPGSPLLRQKKFAEDFLDSLREGLIEDEFWSACGCESPLDSMEISLKNGERRKYRIYCSSTGKIEGDSTRKIRFTEIQTNLLSSRWNHIRAAYCPNGYGCDDGSASDLWSSGAQILTESGWEKFSEYTRPGLAYLFAKIVERNHADDPLIEFVCTATARDRKWTEIRIDSVAAKYRPWAETLAREAIGTGTSLMTDTARTFKLTVYNFSRQK